MRTVLSMPMARGVHPSHPGRARLMGWRRLPKAAGSLVVQVLREWRRRSRDRAQLALLDDRMLRDIGITRADVVTEINKPFWRR